MILAIVASRALVLDLLDSFYVISQLYNVGDRLLTVGGVLTVLNIKTNASKCSIAGIFLIKGITQHYPRY